MVSAVEELNVRGGLFHNSRYAMHTVRYHDVQDDFIKIAIHEMKTPIQAILAYSELLHKEPGNGKEYMEAIFRNAKRLQRLSNNLLDMTSIENHSLALDKERFNINELVSSLIQDFMKQTQNAGQSFENVEMSFEPAGFIFVEADKDRIAQVISNLLGNAIKFTEKGKISIIVWEKKDQHKIIVTIRDSGTGIDAKILSRLFTKFATTSHNGTGLGLFISKCIIKAHEGDIWAENNADGKGASFTFTLPAYINE